MAKYPTPNLSCLSSDDYQHVYEPSEDTFLLLDALEKEEFNIKQLKPLICLEVGSGSGCVSSFIASMLGRETLFLCTDINYEATLSTKKLGLHNGNQLLNPIVTNLTNFLDERLKKSVDILLFNPPYVVTESSELDKTDLLSKSWAGGIKGREVLDKFLPRVQELLSEKGLFYLVVIEANDPDEIKQVMASYGFTSTIILKRQAGAEKLLVLKFKR